MDQMGKPTNVNIDRLLSIIGRLTVEKEVMADQLAALSARVRELEPKEPKEKVIYDADHATRQ